MSGERIGSEHTRAEIAQQPALWRAVGAAAISGDAADRAFLAPLLADDRLRIVLTGAGTSAFAGDLLAPLLRRRLGRRVDAVATTDITSAPREQFAEPLPTLLVSFARSGDSPESVAATELADELLTDCHHLIVTCNPDGELARRHRDRDDSRVLVMPDGSNDRGFAMTSSFTCMVLAVWLRLGDHHPSTVTRGADEVAAAAERVLAERSGSAAEVAAQVARPGSRIVYLGSGPLLGLARESALKILELTAGQVVAMAESALGFRHGPKSIVNADTTIVVFCSTDPYTHDYDADIAAELRAGGIARRVITIGTGPAADADDWQLPLADADDLQLALLGVLCAQLIGLETALAVGTTPDNPFPSGTVNRVVQGVTIHPLPSLPVPVEGTVPVEGPKPVEGPEPVEGRHSHRAVL